MNTKQFFLSVALIAASFTAFAQVGIGTTSPDADAALEIDATDKGLLLPRVALTGTANVAPLSAHVAGMSIYNTATAGDVTPGRYYNDGTQWVRYADGEGSKWTNDAVNTNVNLTNLSDGATARSATNNIAITDAGGLLVGSSNIPSGNYLIETVGTSNTGGNRGLYVADDAVPGGGLVLDVDILGAYSSGVLRGYNEILNSSVSVALMAGSNTSNAFIIQSASSNGYPVGIGTADNLNNVKVTIKSDATSNGTKALVVKNSIDKQLMNISNAGRIGFGNDDPKHFMGIDAGTNTVMQITTTNSGQTINDGIYFGLLSNSDAYLWNYEVGDLRFGTSGTNRMTLTQDGDLGIGLAEPTAKLDVSGYIKVASVDTLADAAPSDGMIRYNNVSHKFEGFANGVWTPLH